MSPDDNSINLIYWFFDIISSPYGLVTYQGKETPYLRSCSRLRLTFLRKNDFYKAKKSIYLILPKIQFFFKTNMILSVIIVRARM